MHLLTTLTSFFETFRILTPPLVFEYHLHDKEPLQTQLLGHHTLLFFP